MSYVNLMGNDRWVEHDHVRRTEAMVREHWTPEDEVIINRKAVGAALGQYALTAQDVADIQDLKAVTEAAQSAGIDGRVDAAQVIAALGYEAIRQQLQALPPVPEEGEDPDAAQRAILQAELDAFSADTVTLVADRDAWRAAQNPPPPEDGEVQP